MRWKDKLINDLEIAITNSPELTRLFTTGMTNSQANIHLAIFTEPFLQLMYNNKKTIESRFSINNIAPYNRVMSGDIVLVKRSGGNIEAIFIAKNIHFFRNLSDEKMKNLEKQLGNKIGWDVDSGFLLNKSQSRYLTLIGITNLTKIPAITSNKKDKTGWSIIKLGNKNTLFEI